jgi:hypothetical protein
MSTVFKCIEISQASLASGNFNGALKSIHDAVERIISEPLCTAQVLASPALDDQCMQIGKAHWTKAGKPTAHNAPSHPSPILYVVSGLMHTGGHSRLVLDMIALQPSKRHFVLSTEIGCKSNINYLQDFMQSQPNAAFETAPDKANFAEKLAWLQSQIIKQNPTAVYILNHHQDSVAIAACIPDLGVPMRFIHHGDHHLCLGVTLPHWQHIDLIPAVYQHCRDVLGIDNHYLPLSFADKNLPDDAPYQPFSNGTLTTATAAGRNKIEPAYYVSYLDIIPAMLAKTGGRHFHVGRLTPWALRRIRKGLTRHGVPQNRFIYQEWTPSVWRFLKDNSVDVYIASFPYGAGLTMIEAQGAGIPIILHQHFFSRVLSGLELAYPQAFHWADASALIAHLCALTPDRLRQESQWARAHYELYHMQAHFVTYLEDRSIAITPPDLRADYRPKLDEWAAWVVSQQGVRQSILIFCYRYYRLLRRIFSFSFIHKR